MLQSSSLKSTFQNTAQIVPKCGAFDNYIHRQSRDYFHISQMAFLMLYDSNHLLVAKWLIFRNTKRNMRHKNVIKMFKWNFFIKCNLVVSRNPGFENPFL